MSEGLADRSRSVPLSNHRAYQPRPQQSRGPSFTGSLFALARGAALARLGQQPYAIDQTMPRFGYSRRREKLRTDTVPSDVIARYRNARR